MKRWLFNLAAAVSLLLCLAVLADRCTHPWRMNWIGYVFSYVRGSHRIEREFSLTTGDGVIIFDDDTIVEVPNRPPDPWLEVGSISGAVDWHRGGFLDPLGFGYFRRNNNSQRHLVTGTLQVIKRGLALPSWFLALLLAMLPAWRFGGWKRRRRRYRLAHGLCVKCGYDLRATPDASGPLLKRCPECGTEARASVTSG